MAVAFLSAQRSKDPNSQLGACIVNAENKIVGIGYNGMPNGCSDDLWEESVGGGVELGGWSFLGATYCLYNLGWIT